MTLKAIKECDKDFLVPSDVAEVLHVSAYTLNVTIHNGGTLPFPYLMIGRRLKFPRKAFIAWCEENI